MKILEAFGEPIADGGQEAFVFGVLGKMNLSGMTIDCLTAYDCRSDYYKALIESKGGNIYALNLPFAPGKSRELIRNPFSAFLLKHSYDVIHIHSGSISVLAIMASEADKAGVKKIIVHSHSTGESDSLKHRVLRYVASLSMRRHVDVYCACSKEAAEWKYEPRYAGKAYIIKNGIDPDRFCFDSEVRKSMRKKLGLTDKDFVIGHVGRFTPEKNHKFLVNVFERLLRSDASIRLLLVGDGDKRKEIEGIVKQRGLQDEVTFAGSVSNVPDYLQAMDLFVLPSLFEGVPISAIEAQASGLPVLLSECITREVGLSDKVQYVELIEKKWLDAICGVYKKVDVNDRQPVLSPFYDLETIAEGIRKLYLK